ncbi:MAG TPA: hypothetical protein DCS07_06480 [Bdellovibrionales bacterium]|jgi:hypothetical protein|nr:hypothetical protein [Bdellovibrionales bacterium]
MTMMGNTFYGDSKNVKRTLRNSFFFAIFSPLIIAIHVTTFFLGKKRSFRFWGPRITHTAKLVVKLFVPDIPTSQHFDQLSAKIRPRIPLWGFVWDIKITEDTKDVLQLHIGNCPFCEVFAFAGLSELNPYACEGDWAYAGEKSDKWSFDRKHQIGTGDSFCDHTYKRLHK